LRTAAEAYLKTGNFARGGELYERANAVDKDNVGGKVRLAQVRLATGDTDRAFKDLESIAKSDSGQSQADLALITAHMQRRDYDKALAAIDALDKKQPDNTVTRNLRGAVYMAKRDFKKARATFEASLAAQPNDAVAANNLTVIDVQEGKADDARKRYEGMIAKDPKNEQLLLALAQLTALTRENPEESKAILDRAVAANPGSARARLALVGYYSRIGDARGALAAAQAAQGQFPDDPTVLENLAGAQLAAGENNQAIATLTRIVQVQPSSPMALLQLSAVQFSTKDYAGAIDSARKALVVQTDLPQAWAILTQAQIAAGQGDAALADAKRLQKEQPDKALGYAIEGEVMASNKKWSEAADSIAAALKRQPVSLLAVNEYAMLTQAGRTADAKAFVETWTREHPTDTAIAELLAQQAMVRKDYPAAIAQYRAVLAINPENATALNNVAWMLSEAGDPKAREYAERAYQLQPFNAQVVDTLGLTLYRTGDTARGTQLLRLASNLAPGDAEIRLHYGQALAKSGDKEGAKRALAPLLAQPAGGAARNEAEKIVGAK